MNLSWVTCIIDFSKNGQSETFLEPHFSKKKLKEGPLIHLLCLSNHDPFTLNDLKRLWLFRLTISIYWTVATKTESFKSWPIVQPHIFIKENLFPNMILLWNTNIISKTSTLIQLSYNIYIYIVSKTYKTSIKTNTADKQRNLVHYTFPGSSKTFETINITKFV